MIGEIERARAGREIADAPADLGEDSTFSGGTLVMAQRRRSAHGGQRATAG